MDPALLIPILVPLGFFALIFGIVYMQKKENLAMIDKGFNPRKGSRGPEPFLYLKWGLLLVGAGVGLLIAYIVDVNMPTSSGDNDHPPLYFALIAIGGGAGLIISYKIEMKVLKERNANSPEGPSEL
jgi:hypothetical protein